MDNGVYEHIEIIGQKLIEWYPDTVAGYQVLSCFYTEKNDLEKAEVYLKKSFLIGQKIGVEQEEMDKLRKEYRKLLGKEL